MDFENPDYAIITCDNTSYLENTAELLCMGQMIDSQEKWQFYRGTNCERPSNKELKYLKGIVISNCDETIKNPKKKEQDDKIFKKYLNAQKRGITNLNITVSEASYSNLGSSDTYDIAALAKLASDIIGDEMITQNDPWIEKLAEFVRYVYVNCKHIKIIGLGFGSLLVAYALGGKIREKPPHSEGSNWYVGKEEITLKSQFFEQPWAQKVIGM